MTQIVGVCGLIGSGKNTVAEILEKEFEFVPVSFASVLKDMCAALFGWDREMLEGNTEYGRLKREEVDKWWSDKLQIPGFSPRFALQYIGTDVLRDHFHKNIWVLAAERNIIKHDRVVISDVRFPNEINMIKSHNGMMMCVTRGPEPDWYKTALTNPSYMHNIYPNIHYSEYAWINTKFDSVIDNDETLDVLHAKVCEALRKHQHTVGVI